MEELAKEWIGYVALGTEIAAAILIASGALEALVLSLKVAAINRGDQAAMRNIWLNFARWLVLALEFELASDVLRTVVAPTWADIGALGAIAVIRTFLNFFLERDLEKAAEVDRAAVEVAASEA